MRKPTRDSESHNTAPPATAAHVANQNQTQSAPAVPENGLLTKAEFARYHKVSIRTIEDWMRLGHIPFRKIRGTVRFNLAEVEAFQRSAILVRERGVKKGGRP